MPRRRLTLPLLLGALIALVALVALAAPVSVQAQARPRIQPDAPVRAGVQRLHFGFGPLRVRPGQNTIDFDATRKLPKVDGWITSFKSFCRVHPFMRGAFRVKG